MTLTNGNGAEVSLRGTTFLTEGTIRDVDASGDALVEGKDGQSYHVPAKRLHGRGKIGERGVLRRHCGRASSAVMFVAEGWRKPVERVVPPMPQEAPPAPAETVTGPDAELIVMGYLISALGRLPKPAVRRILDWAAARFLPPE